MTKFLGGGGNRAVSAFVSDLPWVLRGGGVPCDCFYRKPNGAMGVHRVPRSPMSPCLRWLLSVFVRGEDHGDWQTARKKGVAVDVVKTFPSPMALT